MATLRQIEANRANARKSTGPKTANGKDQSSRNAIKHGLTSTRTLIGQEDSVEYHELRGSLLRDYAPANTQEEILVDRIASATWRTLRSRQMEQNLCNMSIDQWQDKRKGDRPRTAKTENEALVISMVEEDLWKLLFRYDTQISRDFFRSMSQLQKLQNDRIRHERQEANDNRPAMQPKQTKSRPQEDWLPFEIPLQPRTATAVTSQTPATTTTEPTL